MKIKFQKKSIFYRYLISYMAMFLLPIIVVGSCFYFVSVKNLSNKNEENYSEKLQQVASDMQNQFTQMTETAVSIARNSRMRFDGFRELSYSQQMDTLNEFLKYSERDMLSHDVIYYPQKESYLITADGFADKQVYFKSICGLEETDAGEFTRKLDGLSKSNLFLFDTVKDPWLFNVQAMNGFMKIPDALIIFSVNLSDVQARFDLLANDIPGSVALYVDGFRTGVFFQSVPKGADNLLPSNLSDEEIPAKPQRINGFVRMAEVSENGNFEAVLVMYKTLFSENINQFQWMFFLLLFIVLAIGCGIGLDLAYKNYQPIHKIENSLKSVRKGGKKSSSGNEIDSIQEITHSMIEENITIRNQVTEQNDVLFHHTLLAILNGDSHLPYMDQLKNYESVKTGERYFVMVIHVQRDGGENYQALDRVHEVAEAFNEENTYLYCVETGETDSIAIICAVPLEETGEAEEMVRSFEQTLYEPNLRIGVGGIVDSLSRVNLSYVEALSALKCNQDSGVLFYEKLFSASENILYPTGDLLKLAEGIETGNVQMAKECIEDILAKISRSAQTLMFRKTICYEVVNIIIKTASEQKLNIQVERVGQLAALEDAERFKEEAFACLEEVCGQIRQRNSEKTDHFVADVVSYIDRHYCDYDIGLKKLSEEFKMSANYLAILINEKLGQPFREYIIYLRIGKAKQLLEQTNKTVGEISETVGYANPSHFIKMFRGYSGMTPAQYRKNSK